MPKGGDLGFFRVFLWVSGFPAPHPAASAPNGVGCGVGGCDGVLWGPWGERGWVNGVGMELWGWGYRMGMWGRGGESEVGVMGLALGLG